MANVDDALDGLDEAAPVSERLVNELTGDNDVDLRAITDEIFEARKGIRLANMDQLLLKAQTFSQISDKIFALTAKGVNVMSQNNELREQARTLLQLLRTEEKLGLEDEDAKKGEQISDLIEKIMRA